MATIQVDVDLEEFSDREILNEIKFRITHPNLSDKYKKELLNSIRELFNINPNNKPISLLDQMKIDFLINNLDKIKLEDLEKLVK